MTHERSSSDLRRSPISVGTLAVQLLTVCVFALGALNFISCASAEESVVLKNGLSRSGAIFDFPSLNKNPFAAAGQHGKALPIIMIDDGLRRTYMYRRGMVIGDPKQVRGNQDRIEFPFKEPLNGNVIAGIGPLLGVSPFNEFGRRLVTVRGAMGENLSILQGITELTPRYVNLEALKGRPSYLWKMRIATSSLDSPTLQAIFNRRLMSPGMTRNQEIDMRLEHVRFFLGAKRYSDAREQMQALIKKFPDEPNMKSMLVRITEQEASHLINEAKQRAEIGQETFARKILRAFQPQNVGRLTRAEVRQVVEDLDKIQKSVEDAKTKLKSQVAQLDKAQADALAGIVNEIESGLSRVTLPRLSDYLLQADTASIPVASRVSLAVSGWLLGPGEGVTNLTVTTSLIKVRDLVYEYLGTENPGRRKAILEELANLEGANPEYISRILPHLLPPKEFPADTANPAIPGMFTVGLNAPPNATRAAPRYVVQLPPDYDPLREYPCILAVHPPTGTPEQQLDWWAGPHNPNLGFRGGHATRHGYIVVAPAWTRQGQSRYEYTPREHQRILVALRDAMRRTSIDADRVFIVGHGAGGTAAWDMAVSHPDLWAGMIAISSDPGKTIGHYFPNAKHVPLYIVNGELDQVHSKNNHAFSGILDDYVNVHNDAMIVFYRGWGFSFFYDEIHELFDWMNVKLHRRKEIPRELDLVSMRHGDEFFWWLEMNGMKEGTAVDPVLWSQAKRIRGKKIEATIQANNSIRISQGPAERFTLWLRPDMGLDLNEQIVVRDRRRSPLYHNYDGNFTTMLEDARQRADRKRPYWSKVELK